MQNKSIDYNREGRREEKGLFFFFFLTKRAQYMFLAARFAAYLNLGMLFKHCSLQSKGLGLFCNNLFEGRCLLCWILYLSILPDYLRVRILKSDL